MILSQIAEKSIGYSSSINVAFKELLTGKSYGAETQGPAAPEAKPQLTHEQKAKQDKIMQQFYPNYMVDSGIRPVLVEPTLTDAQTYFVCARASGNELIKSRPFSWCPLLTKAV